MPSWKKLVKLTSVRRKKRKKSKYAPKKADRTPEKQDAVRAVALPDVHEVAVTTDIHKELTNQYSREHNKMQSTFPSAPVSGMESEVATSEEGTMDMAAVVEMLKAPLEQAAPESPVESVVAAVVEVEIESEPEEPSDETAGDVVVESEERTPESSTLSSPITEPVAPLAETQAVAEQEPTLNAAADDEATNIESPVGVVEENSPLIQCSLAINIEGDIDELSEVEASLVLQDLSPRVAHLEKIVSQVVQTNNSLIQEIRALKQEEPQAEKPLKKKAPVIPKGFFREPKLHCGDSKMRRKALKERARQRVADRDMVRARQQKVLEEEMEKNIRDQMARTMLKARPVRKYAPVDIQLPRRKIVAGRVPIYERAQQQQQQREERLKDMRRLRDLEKGIKRPAMQSPKKIPLTPCGSNGRVRDRQVLALRR